VYVDTITVSAGGLAASLTDTLTVLAPPPAPSTSPLTLTVSPGSRYRAVKAGSTTLTWDSAAVTLSGTGAASAAWSASATRPWLSLTASAGTGSGMLRWSYNPTGLAAGTYVDTITVVVPNAINSPARVVDSLVVTASKGKTKRIGRTLSTGNSIDGGEGQAGLADSAYVEAEPAAAWSVASAAPWMRLVSQSGLGGGWVRWRRDFSLVPFGISEDSLVVTAGDGDLREVLLTVTETVVSGADLVASDAAATALFDPAAVSALQLRMLDLVGNVNGRYDVGDFLAYFDRTGNRPGVALMARVLALPAVPGRRR
jgi:hypothetical protein